MKTLKQCRDGIKSGEFTSAELVKSYIDRVDNTNSYVYKTFESALTAAEKSDRLIKQGKGGALEGVPLAVKDLFCTKGVSTTACSKMLEGFVPEYESAVTERLFSAGMIMTGKLNMDEFAMGGTNTTSVYGHTVNPLNNLLVTGGSSGGSAAAVAAGLVPCALGSETGDSIRVPAAMCGVVGFKPSYGRVSRYGMVSYSSSLDQAGTLTLTVEDAAILLREYAGFDPRDQRTAKVDVPNYEGLLSRSVKGLKVGVIKELSAVKVCPEVERLLEDALAILRREGAVITEVSLPSAQYSDAIYTVLANAEASSNLSRYDGVRYGHRSARQSSLDELYASTRSEGFGWQIKRRLVIGAYILSAEQFESYFVQAQRIRRMIFDQFKEAFKAVDVILSPVLPAAPPKISEAYAASAGFKEYVKKLDALNLPMSMAGLPQVSVPSPRHKDFGIPMSLQFSGARFNEAGVLSAGHALEYLLKEGV